MFRKLWEWYWQMIANKHFYEWVNTKNESELWKYHSCIDKKFIMRHNRS